MNHAKKMILVPASEMYAQQMVPPVVPQLTNLDLEIQQILDTPNVPADMKLSNYNQVLRRYMKMHNDFMDSQFPQPQTTSPQKSQQTSNLSALAPQPGVNGAEDAQGKTLPYPEKHILNAMTQKNRKRAALLLDFLKHSDPLSWADTGEMKVDGKVIPNSNLIDLVSDFTQFRKRDPVEGASELAGVLKKLNVPRECIGNEERWRLIHKPVSPSTPRTPASGGRSAFVTPPNAPTVVRRTSRIHKKPRIFGWEEENDIE